MTATPIKTVSKYSDTVTTVETFDQKTNLSLSDAIFKPDDDIKFIDMKKMMGNILWINK